MTTCYIFATSSGTTGSEVIDGSIELLSMIKGSNPPPLTRRNLGAVLQSEDTDFQFLLKFEFQTLDDVAYAVLKKRKAFSAHLQHTLTMLQYGKITSDEATDFDSLPRLDDAGRTGILLVRDELVTESTLARESIISLFEGENATCIEVFGPYDFIVEFPAATLEDVIAQSKRINLGKFKAGGHVKVDKLLCVPFHPDVKGSSEEAKLIIANRLKVTDSEGKEETVVSKPLSAG